MTESYSLRAQWLLGDTRRWHYFSPGMSTSECGRVRYRNTQPSRRSDAGPSACHNCRRVKVAFEIKLREAEESNG